MPRALMIGFFAVAAISTLGANAVRAVAQNRDNRADEQAIRNTIAALTDGMNKHDAKTIATLYTSDGDLVNVFGGWWKGPAQIENGLKTHFDAELKRARFVTSDVQIRFIKPDVAVAHVTNQVRASLGRTDKKCRRMASAAFACL
jgi:uncharacterized protein (TIGR02246 family)